MRAYIVRNFELRTVEITVAEAPRFTLICDVPEHTKRELAVRVCSALARLELSRDVSVAIDGNVGKSLLDLDLYVALAILEFRGLVRLPEGLYARAELALDGSFRPVVGDYLAKSRALFAADVTDSGSLLAAVERFRVPSLELRFKNQKIQAPPLADDVLDALRVAALSRQNIALVGERGMSLAARYYASLLETTAREREEARCMASLIGNEVMMVAPFRAPHHTVSAQGLCGTDDRPGEWDLAAGGTLFLDELVEFRGEALDRLAARRPRRGFTSSPCFVSSHAEVKLSQYEARRFERFEERCKLFGITQTIRL